jgi:exodeoxyribonuclease VII large subunit
MKTDVKNEKEEIKDEIFSVGEYLDRLNATLKNEKAKVLGEVSGVQEYPGRSYLYFSLKDKKDGSTVKCFMWKNDYRLSGVTLADGLEIIVSAYPNIYKPNGGMTLQVETVELVGEGALQIAYEKLKGKLAAEGLFDEARKRRLPDFPRKIGVITSKSGAVINDFLSNIGKFGYEILFVDSKVEGQTAVHDLLSALRTLYREKVDVLVLMRGGGSLESFQAFNNEEVARALSKFNAPTLTGIGHDKDAPLVSLVSDANVSTPTAVAHLLSRGFEEAGATVALSEEKILSSFSSGLRDKKFVLENSGALIEKRFAGLFETFWLAESTLQNALGQIESRIARLFEIISDSSKNIFRGFENLSARVVEQISQTEKSLQLGSPEHQLARGYSIVRHAGKIIRSKKGVAVGERLDILLSDGKIESQVTKI